MDDLRSLTCQATFHTIGFTEAKPSLSNQYQRWMLDCYDAETILIICLYD
jgi:hypothetical protein